MGFGLDIKILFKTELVGKGVKERGVGKNGD